MERSWASGKLPEVATTASVDACKSDKRGTVRWSIKAARDSSEGNVSTWVVVSWCRNLMLLELGYLMCWHEFDGASCAWVTGMLT